MVVFFVSDYSGVICKESWRRMLIVCTMNIVLSKFLFEFILEPGPKHVSHCIWKWYILKNFIYITCPIFVVFGARAFLSYFKTFAFLVFLKKSVDIFKIDETRNDLGFVIQQVSSKWHSNQWRLYLPMTTLRNIANAKINIYAQNSKSINQYGMKSK